MDIKIPVYQPYLGGNEKEYVLDCLESNWISSKGKYIPMFEEKFKNYVQTSYALAVSNGTTALHLALVSLGIGPGDEVIVPTLTYIASVNAIMYTGAIPVFVDCLLDTWQIDTDDIKKKITSKTRAIMVVHLYGNSCDLYELQSLCKSQNIFLIEDCAEAIGTLYDNKHVGSFGDISTFSFFGNKTITTGEGGMIVTNDTTLYERALHYRGQGLAKHRQYWHDVIGYNYRMTNICAAIGVAQLEQIDSFLLKKRNLAEYYIKNISQKRIFFQKTTDKTSHSYWMFSMCVYEGRLRDPLRDHLSKKGIETRPLFYPVHTMPMYSNKYQKHKNSEYLGWRGINLPSFPTINQKDLDYIIYHINEFLETE